MPWPTLTLSDGSKIPGVAFGSAGHAEDITPDVIDTAIEVGFSHIDTAQMYRNEAGVGRGLKQSALPRSDLYLTTKWSGWAPIQQSIHESLEKLGVDYVDLYLIHNPRITGGDIEGKWKEFEQVHKQGLAKSIGVSNYSIDDLKRVLAIAKVKPVVNQIILNPHVYESTVPLLEFMAKHDILAEGYSPLKPLRDGSSPGLIKAVEGVAKKHGVKPEQVLMAWSKAKGVLPITTSSNRNRAASYISAGDLDLTQHEIKAIDDAGAQGYKREQMKETAQKVAKIAIGVAAAAYLCLRLIK